MSHSATTARPASLLSDIDGQFAGQVTRLDAHERSRTIAERRHEPAIYVVWFLVIASVVPWRTGVYFSGSLDPVVVIKAILGFSGLAVALFVGRRAGRRSPIGVVSISLVLLLIAISTIGGLAASDFVASTISSVRVLMLAATVTLLIRRFPPAAVIRSLLTTLAICGILVSVSGLPNISSTGRLFGTLPPLNPNTIAMLSGVPAVGLVHEMVVGRHRWLPRLPVLLVLVAIVILTQSRTALLALVVAAVLIVLFARRPDAKTISVLILAMPVIVGVFLYTDTLTQLATRGNTGGQNIATLSSRTIAWNAVLSTPNDTWARWIGSGMTVRQVAVAGQFWEDQVLDSSWISALAQAGVLGAAAMALWVVLVLSWTIRARRIQSLAMPLVVFILIRSFLENGLVDSNVMFIVFFTIALLLERELILSRHSPGGSGPQPTPELADSGLLTGQPR